MIAPGDDAVATGAQGEAFPESLSLPPAVWRDLVEGDVTLGRRWSNLGSAEFGHAGGVLLSVCIPYYRYDVTALVGELLRQSVAVGGVEILLADDGSGDDELTQKLVGLLAASKIPATLLIFERNVGRAPIRNCLAALATGEFTLFLDADMFPDSSTFLAIYEVWARRSSADIVVGGRSYHLIQEVSPAQRLYRYHSDRTECLPAIERQATVWRHVFTNNMMVRTAVLRAVPFDPGYAGWGYEDTDWALRALERATHVQHIENTATHFGLVDDETLLLKYQESVTNFGRVLERFPQQISQASVFKAAKFLGKAAFPQALLRAAAEAVVRHRWGPLVLRYCFLQLYKSLLYADVVRKHRG